MAEELIGKVAIVTGGASGIGRAAVELFIQEGARVVIADLDAARGEPLASGLGEAAAFKRADVTSTDDVQALVYFAVDRFGQLDVMFNNAGIPGNSHGTFAADDLSDFDQVMRVNLLGVMLGTRAAARAMTTTGGSIINTGSIGGILPGFGIASYRTSKAAVNHFTKCAAIEFAARGIRVNCINPGATPTEMHTQAPEGMDAATVKQLGQDLSDILLAGQPLKRRGRPIDVANAALYLASDRSSQMTGQMVNVDGGHSTGDPVNYAAQMEDARHRAFAVAGGEDEQ